jgi:hypothetical protein
MQTYGSIDISCFSGILHRSCFFFLFWEIPSILLCTTVRVCEKIIQWHFFLHISQRCVQRLSSRRAVAVTPPAVCEEYSRYVPVVNICVWIFFCTVTNDKLASRSCYWSISLWVRPANSDLSSSSQLPRCLECMPVRGKAYFLSQTEYAARTYCSDMWQHHVWWYLGGVMCKVSGEKLTSSSNFVTPSDPYYSLII